MTGNIGPQKTPAAILPHPSARLDLVPCQGPNCRVPGHRCMWCQGGGLVLRSAAEARGWTSFTTSVRGERFGFVLLEGK